MKSTLLLAFVIAAFFVSSFVVSQTTLVEPELVSSPVPQALKTLEVKLANVDSSISDRNSRLRLERAQMYYLTAQQYHAANWQVRALDHAKRGLRLIELRESKLKQRI